MFAMSHYFKIIILIVCLLETGLGVLLQNHLKELYPPIIKHAEWVESDNTIYSFPSDNYSINYLSSKGNFNENYDYPPTIQAKGTVRIPVLTYHHIAPLPSSTGLARDYYVSPAVFEQQLEYLTMKNYKVLTLKEFYDQVNSGKNPTQKSVLLTFDDGNLDNYLNAFPLLQKYHFVGVFFIPTNQTGISKKRLKEMSDAGMIIDSHSENHIDLTNVTDPNVLNIEIAGSKYVLKNITGEDVEAFCYPGCGYNKYTVAAIKSAGYLMAFTCGGKVDQSSRIMYALPRMHIYNDMTEFKQALSGIWQYPTNYSN